jgi:hypothetical protein
MQDEHDDYRRKSDCPRDYPRRAAKPTKKARVAPRRAHVSPSQAKSGKKATPAKKGAKSLSRESHEAKG